VQEPSRNRGRRRALLWGALCLTGVVAVYLLSVWFLPGSATSQSGNGRGQNPPGASARQPRSSTSETGAAGLRDTGIEEVVADQGRRASARAEKVVKLVELREGLPPQSWHVERVRTIQGESIEQLVENLANFDDMHFASTSTTGWSGVSPGADGYVVGMLPNLFRVRRLLALGRDDPTAVVPQLQKALRESLKAWPDAFREELRGRESKLREVVHKTGPTLHDKLRTRTEASTYLLAELASHDSLPLLLESYRTQQKWINAIPEKNYRWISQSPIPPALSLYAMHRLVASFPRDGLPAQARAAHDRYMEWAAKNVPPSGRYKGVGPSSPYDESDPRIALTDSEGLLVRDEPKMDLCRYPIRFADGEKMQKYDTAPYVTERSRQWFGFMEAFIVSAFPEENPPAGGGMDDKH